MAKPGGYNAYEICYTHIIPLEGQGENDDDRIFGAEKA
jgi:hypothetical protein